MINLQSNFIKLFDAWQRAFCANSFGRFISSDQDLGNGTVSGTARGCAKELPDGFEDGDCKELTVVEGVIAEYCYCKSELCNSSGKFNNSIISIGILVLVSYLMK